MTVDYVEMVEGKSKPLAQDRWTRPGAGRHTLAENETVSVQAKRQKAAFFKKVGLPTSRWTLRIRVA